MKKDLGITKDWELKIIDTSLVNRCFIGDVTEVQFNGNWEETKANAKLIADAGNTAQQCGLLPSELLKQRDELLGVLKECECQLNYLNGKFGETGTTNAMLAKINNATK